MLFRQATNNMIVVTQWCVRHSILQIYSRQFKCCASKTRSRYISQQSLSQCMLEGTKQYIPALRSWNLYRLCVHNLTRVNISIITHAFYRC